MRYLKVDEILRINRKVLGTDAGLRDFHLLASAAARPQASAFGEDAYTTLQEKAAALLHSLTLNHPFVDGNKRTATLAMLAFLRLNGFRVTWNPPDALEYIIEVAEGKHDVPAIAAWFAERIAPLE